MANLLTGDYEAVLQVAIRQLTGLLGTLHQNGASQDNPMTLPHSEIGRIGDPRRRPPDGGVLTDGGVFADWVTEYQRGGSGRGLSDIQTGLIATAPPGAARLLTDAFAALRAGWIIVDPVPPPGLVRGMVKLQLSSVTIAVPEGSSSEVTVNAAIRARYYPDQGTTDLPAPVHGNVQVAFRIRKIGSRSGPKLLILPSTEDAKIQFIAAPGSGLSVSDQNTLSAEVRKALRESMTPAPAALPRDFPFSDFKGVGSGATQAIALPFQLSGASAPASGVQPLTQSFIGSSGFAVAVSATYVSGLFDLEAIRQAMAGTSFTVHISVWPFSASVTYRLRFTSGPTLTFVSGGIEIAGSVAAETNTWWAPNGSISFKQTVRLMLDISSQAVTPLRFNDPQVDQSWFIPHQTVVNTVKSQIDNALIANTPAVRSVFAGGKTTLLKGLSSFDPFASVTYTGIDITPDGVIVRGEIGSLPRRPAVVNIAETENSSAFTAFESWIPAGRIDRFIWSWIEYTRFNVWSGVEKSYTDEHRFIFPKPAAATQLGQICLRVEGAQISPGGQNIGVAAGTTCSVGEFELAIDVPSWWGPITLPVWQPDIADTTILRSAIAAHVSIHADSPAKEPLSRNVLVYFADWKSQKPLDSLNAALSRVETKVGLMVIVVLPAGAFDASRREVENRLASSHEPRIPVHFTEDDEGGWTRIFAAGKKPSAYLINARRELVWKHEGEPDPAELVTVLNRHLSPTSAPRFRPLQLTVSHGDAVPEVWLEAEDREQFSFQRLRGRDVLVNFWQSWSAPCLAELSRLQRLYEGGKGTPFIVAIHGGSDSNALADIQKRLGLSFSLVQDTQQQIARRYGVRCWPTTIAIRPDGRAESVQFGAGHDHRGAAGPAEDRPA
jgi:peroxiredoxin